MIPKTLKLYLLPSHLAFNIREWSGNVKHAELPVDQPSTVAFTAFADVWPRATETEIGAILCAIGARMTLTFDFGVDGPIVMGVAGSALSCKEITVRKFRHWEGKKKEMKTVRKKEGNFKASRESKRNSRNQL